MRHWLKAGALALSLVLGGCGMSLPGSIDKAKAQPAAEEPLTLASDTAISPRLHELMFHSQALEADVGARVLLPADYDENNPRQYPVLYLLHGCCDFDVPGFAAWTTHSDVEALTEGLPLIVVMPMGSRGGLYADWYNFGGYGAPRWETHHIRELLPWIEGHYRVRTDRNGRMLAGLSMGGHGSFTYAAKYPDLFASAAAYSPMLDTNTERGIAAVHVLETADVGVAGGAFGERPLEEVRWRGHNPVDLAENLGNTQLFIRTGDGTQDGVPVAPTDPIESIVSEMSANMDQALTQLGIAHFYEDYGHGGHSWPFWQDDLHLTLPQQLAYIEGNPPAPELISYLSIDPVFSVFGWNVDITRDVLEFARLGTASRSGFTLSGSGKAVVTTPDFYKAGCAYLVATDDVASTLNADAAGRLVIPVDLGPSRTLQQYRVPGDAGYLRTANVTVGAVEGSCN